MDYAGHSLGFEYAPTLYEKLHYFRNCSSEDILSLVVEFRGMSADNGKEEIHDGNACFTKVFQCHQHCVDFRGVLLPNTWDMDPHLNILFILAVVVAAR